MCTFADGLLVSFPECNRIFSKEDIAVVQSSVRTACATAKAMNFTPYDHSIQNMVKEICEVVTISCCLYLLLAVCTSDCAA